MIQIQRWFFLISLMIFTTNAIQAQGWDEVEIKSVPVTDDFYMLEGRGGNIGLLITDDQAVLIDGQFAELHDKIMTVITETTDKPLQTLINTHWHRDHTGGNALFHAAGATIMAHEAVKARLKSGGTVPFFGSEVSPQPEEALPERLFTENIELNLKGESLKIIMAPAAHTDGDAFVFMEANNVIHMGDIYFAEMYPFIDLHSGGSIKGTIAACRMALEMADTNTMVVPGHGPLTDSKALADYTFMLEKITLGVEAMHAQGADLKAVTERAEDLTGPYNERFGNGFISAKDLLIFIYKSL